MNTAQAVAAAVQPFGQAWGVAVQAPATHIPLGVSVPAEQVGPAPHATVG